MHYHPTSLPVFPVFWFLFALLVTWAQIGIMQYVFERMGVQRRYMFSLLLLCLLGSYINIPSAQLPAQPVSMDRWVNIFGVEYVVPVLVSRPGTIMAVNLGGGIIPLALSAYLILKHRLYLQSVMAVGIITLVVHQMAHAVPGEGITVPVFIPPLITAIVAVLISRWHAGPLAYIAGSLGTLIGADLLNLGKIQGLGVTMASIGGAGKFDGIFLTGIVAVLLAGMLSGPKRVWQANEVHWRPIIN